MNIYSPPDRQNLSGIESMAPYVQSRASSLVSLCCELVCNTTTMSTNSKILTRYRRTISFFYGGFICRSHMNQNIKCYRPEIIKLTDLVFVRSSNFKSRHYPIRRTDAQDEFAAPFSASTPPCRVKVATEEKNSRPMVSPASRESCL